MYTSPKFYKNASVAESLTTKTGVTSIGSTWKIAPVIKNGKETGKIQTWGKGTL